MNMWTTQLGSWEVIRGRRTVCAISPREAEILLVPISGVGVQGDLEMGSKLIIVYRLDARYDLYHVGR
jgi:hypothetical protein